MLKEETSLLLYLFVFIFSAYMMYCAYLKYNTLAIRRCCLIIAFVMPVLLAAFRACGTDIYTYAAQYNRALKEPILWFWQEGGSFEVAFDLIKKAARHVGSIRIMLAICAVITVLPVYASVWERRDSVNIGYVILAFLMNFYPTSFNIIRQYMAIGIVCLSYKYIFNRNFIKFIICILLAAMCHSSAIAFIPAYFLWTKDNDLAKDWRLWAILLVVLVVSLRLESFLGSGIFSGDLERFEGYLDGHGSGQNRDFLLNVVIAVMIIPLLKQLSRQNNKNKFYFVMLLMQCLIGLTGFNSPYIKRVGLYYGIAEIFILGAIPKLQFERKTKVFIKVAVLIYIVGKFLLVDYFLNQPKIIPYKWEFPAGLI